MSKFLVKYLCPKNKEWVEVEKSASDWLDDNGNVFQTAREVIVDWAYGIADKGPFEIETIKKEPEDE